jgi:NhaA family Na+:H+ antiporter
VLLENAMKRLEQAGGLDDPAEKLVALVGPAVRPQGTSWAQLAGVATVAGIGFTVPLFVADLAFPDGRFQAPVKLGLLLASVVSGVAGALVLLRSAGRSPPTAG